MATVERPSPLQRFFRRLTASEAELDAEELQRSANASGCMPACDVTRGQMVKISGRLRTVVYTPRTNLPTLEVLTPYSHAGLLVSTPPGGTGSQPGREAL